MIKKAVSLLILITGLFFTATVSAQEHGPFYAGFYMLYAIENFDEQNTQDKFTAPVAIDLDDTYGVQLRGGCILNEYFSAEAMFEYLMPLDTDLKKGYTSEIDVMNFTLNAKATLPLKEQFVPYAIFGMGFMNTYEEIRGPSMKDKSDWGVGVRMGFGADVRLNPKISLGGEIAHIVGLGNVDHAQYTNITVCAYYHF